jgi:hypothetical protein
LFHCETGERNPTTLEYTSHFVLFFSLLIFIDITFLSLIKL